MTENARHRAILLAALYEAREARPKQGWVFERDLRARVEEPAFALEILKELGHIEDLGIKYRITAKGALAHEAAQEG